MFNIYVYTVHCTTRTVVVSDKMHIYILYSIFYVPGPNIIYSETESAHDVES